MPDIGYYTLPVIPSFRGIESSTQDALDKAFRDSGKKSGEAYAEEHEKAFRQKKVDASRNPDSTTVEADKRRGAASGKAEADAHNDAFNKTRAEDPAAVDTATKVGTEAGKASGKAAGDAHNEEVKKTTQAQSGSIGKAMGEALGSAAGSAAADMIEDMLPKALRGLGLQGLGRDAGEQLGGAIGEHAADVPDALIKGWDTAADTIKRGTDTVKDALSGIKSTAGDTHISLSGIGDGLRTAIDGVRDGSALHTALDGIKSTASGLKDGLGGAVDSLRHLSTGDVTTGLGRTADIIERMEPVASAFGADVSSWPADIRGVIDPISQVSDTFGGVRDSIKGAAEGLGVLVEGSPAAEAAFAGLASAAGPLAALALAIVGAAAGIHQIISDTDPSHGFVRPQGQAPVQTPAAQMALPGQQQPVQLPPSVRPGQQYTATPGSLDPFAALQPAGTPSLTPQQQQPRLVLPPSPIGIDTGGHQAGGPINGPGPKGKDSVLMWGAPGEHVLTAAEVDSIGGHAAVYAMRAAMAGGALHGYQGGGAVVGNPPGLERYVDAMNGTPYSTGGRTDCSGMAARIANVYLGQEPQPSFTTQSEASWLAQHGAIMGLGPPGTLRFGWYNHGSGIMDGHTAVTLPDGRNAESGGSHGGFLVGGGAAGADNPEFEQHAYFPRNPQGVAGGGAGSPLGVGMGGAAAGGAGGTGGAYGAAGGGGGAVAGGAGGTGGAAATTSGGGRGSPFQQAGGMAGIGGIGAEFMKDTFGFGSILPGLDEFPPMQFLSGLLGGLLGGGSGGGGGLFGSLGAMLGGGDGGGSQFGMIPGVGGSLSTTTPGSGSPGPPAFDPALPGLSAGLGSNQPQGESHVIDQSLHVNVSGRSDDEMIGRLGRVIQHPPRVMTHAPVGT